LEQPIARPGKSTAGEQGDVMTVEFTVMGTRAWD